MRKQRSRFTPSTVTVTDSMLPVIRSVGEYLNVAIASNHPYAAQARWRHYRNLHRGSNISYDDFTKYAALAGFVVEPVNNRRFSNRKPLHSIRRRKRPSEFDVLPEIEHYGKPVETKPLTPAEIELVEARIDRMVPPNEPTLVEDILYSCQLACDGHLSRNQFMEIAATMGCRETRVRDRKAATYVALLRSPYISPTDWLQEHWDGARTPVKALLAQYKAGSGGGRGLGYTAFKALLCRTKGVTVDPGRNPSAQRTSPAEGGADNSRQRAPWAPDHNGTSTVSTS